MTNYYRRVITHSGLNKSQLITAPTARELDARATAKLAQWDEQWRRKVEREQRAKDLQDAKAYAKELTDEADKMQADLDTILVDAVHEGVFCVESLKETAPYKEPQPVQPELYAYPAEPVFSDQKYHPKMPLGVKLSRKKTEAFDRVNKDAYDRDHQAWNAECESIDRNNDAIKQQFAADLAKWNSAKTVYEDEQNRRNEQYDALETGFESGDANAVERYIELAVNAVRIPLDFDQSAWAEFNKDTKSFVIDAYLPSLEDIPTLKSVSYVQSRGEYKESMYSEAYLKKKYDSVVYQYVLALVNTVFTAGGESNPTESVVLNGYVRTVDKSTGKPIEPCVLSLNTTRDAISEIRFDAVDPKAWFKSSKGVSAASLAKVTPVAPIVQMSREDRRFIEGYSVADDIDEGTNLAAMDWQDFENLIRELFEQEFSVPGGEVKITQASRDGGVDAVVFDPDPIRGGKIVIQAKRYTNTVGVSAVRDLYGTVMNEGAMKGILVTTASYGNDAYEFAQGKPLTLINGGNLLSLLEKHGHKARIDLKEAKETLRQL